MVNVADGILLVTLVAFVLAPPYVVTVGTIYWSRSVQRGASVGGLVLFAESVIVSMLLVWFYVAVPKTP